MQLLHVDLYDHGEFFTLDAMKHTLHQVASPLESQALELSLLILESDHTRKGLLKDSRLKHNYILAPRSGKMVPLVVHLSGFTGNGPANFNQKVFEENFSQQVATATDKKAISLAVHVFVDAMTAVGGSQFINSDACGNFSDYILEELVPAVEGYFKIDPRKRYVVGGSSGGYGALHLISQKNSPFTHAIAMAPDADFEKSILPHLYVAAPFLTKVKTLTDALNLIHDSDLKKRKNYFDILNALAMTLCYSPLYKGRLQYPIDLETGELNAKIWNIWKAKDPIYFMEKNASSLKGKHITLGVGKTDEFALYFGARQIAKVLKAKKIKHTYTEFEGGHFNLAPQKLKSL